MDGGERFVLGCFGSASVLRLEGVFLGQVWSVQEAFDSRQGCNKARSCNGGSGRDWF